MNKVKQPCLNLGIKLAETLWHSDENITIQLFMKAFVEYSDPSKYEFYYTLDRHSYTGHKLQTFEGCVLNKHNGKWMRFGTNSHPLSTMASPQYWGFWAIGEFGAEFCELRLDRFIEALLECLGDKSDFRTFTVISPSQLAKQYEYKYCA